MTILYCEVETQKMHSVELNLEEKIFGFFMVISVTQSIVCCHLFNSPFGLCMPFLYQPLLIHS